VSAIASEESKYSKEYFSSFRDLKVYANETSEPSGRLMS